MAAPAPLAPLALTINNTNFKNFGQLGSVVTNNSAFTKFSDNVYTGRINSDNICIVENRLYITDNKFKIDIGDIFVKSSANIELINDPILSSVTNIKKVEGANVVLKKTLESLATIRIGTSIVFDKKTYTIEDFKFMGDVLYIENTDNRLIKYDKSKITIAKELTNANKSFNIGHKVTTRNDLNTRLTIKSIVEDHGIKYAEINNGTFIRFSDLIPYKSTKVVKNVAKDAPINILGKTNNHYIWANKTYRVDTRVTLKNPDYKKLYYIKDVTKNNDVHLYYKDDDTSRNETSIIEPVKIDDIEDARNINLGDIVVLQREIERDPNFFKNEENHYFVANIYGDNYVIEGKKTYRNNVINDPKNKTKKIKKPLTPKSAMTLEKDDLFKIQTNPRKNDNKLVNVVQTRQVQTTSVPFKKSLVTGAIKAYIPGTRVTLTTDDSKLYYIEKFVENGRYVKLYSRDVNNKNSEPTKINTFYKPDDFTIASEIKKGDIVVLDTLKTTTYKAAKKHEVKNVGKNLITMTDDKTYDLKTVSKILSGKPSKKITNYIYPFKSSPPKSVLYKRTQYTVVKEPSMFSQVYELKSKNGRGKTIQVSRTDFEKETREIAPPLGRGI